MGGLQQFSDVPAGYSVLPPSGAPPPPSFSDVPDGYKVLPAAPAAPPLTPPPTMAQVPGAVPGTPTPTQVPRPSAPQMNPEPPPGPPVTPTISAYQPTNLDRLKQAVPVVGQVADIVTGRKPAMAPMAAQDTTQLAYPERVYSPSEQEAHPVRTGFDEFAGSLTAPDNLLLMHGLGALGILPGKAAQILPRIASAGFSAQMVHDAVKLIPDAKAAWEKGDHGEAERIATHAVLATLMASLGIRHAVAGESGALVKDATDKASIERNSLNKEARDIVNSAGMEHPYNATPDDLKSSLRQYKARAANAAEADQPAMKDKSNRLEEIHGRLNELSPTGEAPKYSDVPEGYKVLPPEEAPVHHTSNDVEELRASAERQAPQVGDTVADATEGVPGAKVEAVRDSKDTDRIEDKAARQGVQPSQIGDIAAAKVTVPDQQAADKVLQNIHQQMPVESAEGKVTGEPGKNDVRQTQAIVNTNAPAGEPVKKAEVLLQTPEMHAATEDTHDDYRKAQELRTQGKETEATALEQGIIEQHNAAEQAARARLQGGPNAQSTQAADVGRQDGRQTSVQDATAGASAAEKEKEGSATTTAGRRPDAAPTQHELAANLQTQTVEVRHPQTGEWKQGKVLADNTTGGNEGTRRLRGVYDDGQKFDNVKIQDVRRPSVGVDFDGTLFKQNSDGSIGDPIPERIASLKKDIAAGQNVVIESHRAGRSGETEKIHAALESVGLPRLPVTPKKDASAVLIGDKEKQQSGVKLDKVETNANTPLPQPTPNTQAATDWHAEALKQAREKLPNGTLSDHLREAARIQQAGKPVQAPRPIVSGPAPGKVGEMNVSDLKVAPTKFQYKFGTDTSGTSTLLKEAAKYNPELAGTISVWRDPADGKYYVVNGHHRFELAKRMGEKTVAVRHVVAKDATEARAIGALQNIAEGRGTAVDAAKFFRDTGLTVEDLKAKGISLGEATAADGIALSRLSPEIFNRVVAGTVAPGRAKTIGEATPDHAEQKAILSLVEKKEARGTTVNNATLAELIRLVKGSEQTTETTADLFGNQTITKSLAIEKAEISAHIKQQLAKDKKLFGFVAKEGRADELARAGNKIEVEKSKEISTQAAQAEEVYNKLSERGGPISGILDQAARRLADGDNAGTVKAEAYSRVRAEVSKTLGGSEGASVERPETAPEPQPKAATVEPTLPGMEHVPSERAEASAEQQGKDLTAKLTEPPKSIESKAGEIEQKSPLFRDTEANPQRDMFGELLKGETGSLTPSALKPSNIRAEYDKAVKEFIDSKVKIGEKYYDLAKVDETIANTLRLVDNAPRYYKDKAIANLARVTKGLTDDQVRLASMLVDSDSRDYLQDKKPDEYQEALQDSKVQTAVNTFQPLQEELARDRMALGWPVRKSLHVEEDAGSDKPFVVKDRDGAVIEAFKSEATAMKYADENGEVEPHLKRTYPEHSKNPLPAETGAGDFTGSFVHDKGLRPPKIDRKAREMSAEYHYEHGRKDFSGYLESYKQVKTAMLKQNLFDDFTSKAEKWTAGTAQPSKIEYDGKTYYRPDIVAKAKEGKTDLPAYGVYDPTRGERFMMVNPAEDWATQVTGKPGIKASDRFLGPKTVVDAMENYDKVRGGAPSKIRRVFQEQIVGLFGPVVHVNNIMRHLGHATGLGTFDPRSWPSIAKVLMSPDLRQRVLKGVDDATIDMLTQQGAYTDWGDIGSLNAYIGGNFNPFNYTRALGKGILFDPKFKGGWGGLDPKARVVVADYLQSHNSKLTDHEIADAVNDAFGNYNRANWTERQRQIARFTLFPGWDTASAKWFLRHPFKVGVAGSLVVLAVNLALHQLGKNKDEDSRDMSYIHIGDRKLSSGLVSDSMGNHLMAPVIGALQAKLNGDDIGAGAVEGTMKGSSALAGTLGGPIIEMVADEIYNKKYAGGASEIVKPQDKYTPGTWAPNVEIEKRIAFAALKGSPALNRFIDNKGHWDWAQGIGGGMLGVTNYKYGAEERFKANVAKAAVYGETLKQLSESNPDAASDFVRDPMKATYLMFHDDLEEMNRDLRELDTEIERVRGSDLPHEERQSVLSDLKDNRNDLLKAADGLNDALAERKAEVRKDQASYWQRATNR